jgi:GTP-binding protein Era
MSNAEDDDVQLPAEVPDLQQQVVARWELAAEEVEVALQRTLAVAFLGSASAGKDSAIKALFGLDYGQIDPIPGSTDEVRVAAVDRERRLLVINAPGFGDLRDEVEAKARRVLEQLDLAIYVLNCDGGATIDERRDLDQIRALGRPTLVCLNKIDLIRPAHREDFVRQTLLQLGTSPEDAVITAFDPLPALSREPIGVDRVVRWIHEHLQASGKALLFAKHLRNKAAACEPIIQTAAKKSAMAGAIPVPGADATAVTAIQVKLISDIAAVHDRRIDKDLVLFILGEALAGSSKGFVRWAVRAAKAAGWIPGGQVITVATSALGATIAGATTYGVGKAAIAFMQRGGEMTGAELRDVFDAEAFEYSKVAREDDAGA